MKKIISFVVAILLSFTAILTVNPFSTIAENASGNVAKVGLTEYENITEAVNNWTNTNGSTLTLLSNVTLEDTITIMSTEHHILELGTYTMTAAEGKNAIEIKAGGTGSSEKEALTINADATNPGGINANKKACIYYKYGGISAEDRPIITINGGVFTGNTSTLLNYGIHTIGSAARKCATIIINGGVFDCSIYQASKGKLLITGGTFNYSVGSQGDSTAYRLISGGKFKTFGFMTADAYNTKFWIGSKMAVSDRYVYIDDAGYTCVYNEKAISDVNETEFIKDVGIKAKVYGGKLSNDLLQYSSAVTEGVYYTDENVALTDYNAGKAANKYIVNYGLETDKISIKNIDLETDLEMDATISNVLPTGNEESCVITLKAPNATFAVSFYEGEEPNVTVKSGLDIYEVVTIEPNMLLDAEKTIIKRVYSLNKLPVYASIGATEYLTLADAVEAAQAGQTITVLNNIEEDGLIIDKDITIDLNGFSYTIEGTVGSVNTKTNGLQLLKGNTITIKNGTISSKTAKILVQNYANLTLENVTLDGSELQGNTPYSLSNNSGNIVIKDSKIIASANGVAFDVCDYANYTAPTVSVENSVIKGKIEITDNNGGEFVGSLGSGQDTYTALGGYIQLGSDIIPINDYNFSLNVNNENVRANEVITVEVVIDKDYYSLDYKFTYDTTKFSCEQDVDDDGVIEVNCFTAGNAGVLATYELTALNNIERVTVTDLTIDGEVIQYYEQALYDVVNEVTGEVKQIKISLAYTAETKTDYVTGYSLVLIKGDDAGYAFDGSKMFYVKDYQAFAILVEDEVTEEEINEKLSKTSDCNIIEKSYNVNGEYILDAQIDLKDATAAYACYNLDFNVNEYMDLFLRADVNNDYRVNFEDVNDITAHYTK